MSLKLGKCLEQNLARVLRCKNPPFWQVQDNDLTTNDYDYPKCINACKFTVGLYIFSGNIKLLVKAFVVYVRPIVEYNSIIWLPCLKKYNDLV